MIQSYAYGFDPVGNITAITDNAPITSLHTISVSQSFTYNGLNRLIDSSVWGSYAYDEVGNITTKEGVTLTYTDPAHPSSLLSYRRQQRLPGELRSKRQPGGEDGQERRPLAVCLRRREHADTGL